MKSKRYLLWPGTIYRLHDHAKTESLYRVLDVLPADDWSDYNAELRNISSGWTFTAHGTNIYPDNTIDWDFSTNGRFVK